MDTNLPGSAPPPPPPPPPSLGGGSGGEIIYPQQPVKDPILIAVLNLVVAGCLGYFMIGQKIKAITTLVIFVVGLFLTCGVVSLLVSLAAAVDGYFQAQALQAGHPVGPWTFFQQHL